MNEILTAIGFITAVSAVSNTVAFFRFWQTNIFTGTFKFVISTSNFWFLFWFFCEWQKISIFRTKYFELSLLCVYITWTATFIVTVTTFAATIASIGYTEATTTIRTGVFWARLLHINQNILYSIFRFDEIKSIT